jgi:hypothetical protein
MTEMVVQVLDKLKVNMSDEMVRLLKVVFEVSEEMEKDTAQKSEMMEITLTKMDVQVTVK